MFPPTPFLFVVGIHFPSSGSYTLKCRTLKKKINKAVTIKVDSMRSPTATQIESTNSLTTENICRCRHDKEMRRIFDSLKELLHNTHVANDVMLEVRGANREDDRNSIVCN